MIKDRKIGVIILAAGSSSRLGYPKQLVKFKGTPLLQYTIGILNDFQFDSHIIVLGSKADEIKKKIDSNKFEVVFNENWKEGISSSIRIGLSESLIQEPDLDHILLLLSDQPLITKEKLEELIKVHLRSYGKATFSEYAGDIGVPAIFSRQVFSELKKLKGNQGAKKLVIDKKLGFEKVQFQGGNFDVDTAADVELLKQME